MKVTGVHFSKTTYIIQPPEHGQEEGVGYEGQAHPGVEGCRGQDQRAAGQREQEGPRLLLQELHQVQSTKIKHKLCRIKFRPNYKGHGGHDPFQY